MSDLDQLHLYCAKGSDTKAKLTALAKKHKRSQSAEMQVLIDEAFDAMQREESEKANAKRNLRG